MSNDSLSRNEHVKTADQRVYMHGLSWNEFETFIELRGEKKPRVTFLEGTLELMSPSPDHEQISRRLARVVEQYFEHLGIEYDALGSWLLKHAPGEARLEPDECFTIGREPKQRPDLAIEVVWTSGGISKRDVYRRLGVREVWFWNDDKITFHVLVGNSYEDREVSEVLPSFDRQLAYDMLALPVMSDVARALRERLR